MKNFFRIVLVLILACAATASVARFPRGSSVPPQARLQQQNVYGLTGSAWLDTSNYYTPGTGNPAVSTSDWFYTDGSYWMRPYDLLDSACGSAGATVAAANGRYAWLWSPDHPSGSPYADAQGFWLGFSNDPGVFPTTARQLLPYAVVPLAKVADITASIAGNTLTVTSVTGYITFGGPGVINGTGVTQAAITAQTSGAIGKAGTYTIDGSPQTVSSRAMTVSQQNYFLYMTPYLVCNPDDASNTFYIYGEGSASSIQNETGYIKSNDLVTFTSAQPTHVVYSFGPFSSYQKVVRSGVNSWYSIGYQANFPQNVGVYGMGKWTSADGVVFDPPGTSMINTCVPSNPTGAAGNLPCNAPSALSNQISSSTPRITVGGQDYAIVNTDTMVSGTRVGNQWAARVPIDSNFNVLASPAPTYISSPYAGNYPGPTYINEVSGYVEDGVAHYYAAAGFPKGGTPGLGIVVGARFENGGTCGSIPAANGVLSFFQVVGEVTGTTLNVSSVVTNNVVVGGQIAGSNIDPATLVTGVIATTPGYLASYSVSVSHSATGSVTINGYTCGGLQQQAKDYYTEIIDQTSASGAAPVGVKASCASSVASLTWFDALPTQTYRLYRGTTAGSQTTLVGDFTGTSATDSGMTLNAVTYYKLVYLNGGVEKKNRVVSTYCSSSVAEVNAHMTRALAAGADPTTCNRAWMDTFYGWLASNSLKADLRYATMAEFCVAKSGSTITKIFDMGGTYLPRGGDYVPLTSNTSYSASGINGNPSWVNSTGTAYGAYGSGRYNNIRRYKEITLFAAYQKSHTGQISTFTMGQFSNILQLSHLAGTPGSVEFKLSDATQLKTATASLSGLATDFHTIAGTYSSATGLIAYGDAAAGTAQTGLVVPSPKLTPYGMLDGQIDSNNGIGFDWRTLMSGSDQGMVTPSTGTYTMTGSLAQYNGGAQFMFDKALTSSQISSLNSLIRTHFGF